MGSSNSVQRQPVEAKIEHVPVYIQPNFEPYQYSYDDLENALKTTDGLLKAFTFINIIEDFRCIHGESRSMYCNACKDEIGDTTSKIIKLSHEDIVYLPLFPRIGIRVHKRDAGVCVALPRYITYISSKQDVNIYHLKRLKPIVKRLFDFYDAFTKKKLTNMTIEQCEKKFNQYRISVEEDFNIIISFEELDKITQNINDENKNDVEGACDPSAPTMN